MAIGNSSTIFPSENIRKAELFLLNTKGKGLQGSVKQADLWDSRWAVNFINGVESVVSGLRAIGYSSDDPIFSGIISWLTSGIQNLDGGFGESVQSYEDSSFIGRGISTATQTAWALNTLINLEAIDTIQAQKAVQFLIHQILTNRKWLDPSLGGTGHPALVDMVYPLYAYAHPLMALAKFLDEACKSSEKYFEVISISQKNAMIELCY